MQGDYTEISDAERIHPNPLVSVVMITYRHEDYLAQAIESIASQKTDFPFEIVVSDDCSPDRTLEVALEMQRKYPDLVRVAFTPKNKGGQLNARFALGLCRGKYIAACEGDDFWTDDHKLGRQIAALEKNPEVDIAFTRGHWLYFEDGRMEEGWDHGPIERVIPADELFGSLTPIAPSASLVWRAEVSNFPPWYDEAPIGDLFLLIAGSVRGGAYYEPRSTVVYRSAHPTSFTVGSMSDGRRGWIEHVKKTIRYLEIACDHYGMPRSVLANRLNDFRLRLATDQIATGQLFSGLRTLAQINPSFLARGVGRRAARIVRRLLPGSRP